MPNESTTNANPQEETAGIDNGIAPQGIAESSAGKSEIVTESLTNNDTTSPREGNRHAGLATAKDWADFLSKAIPLVAGTIYLVGYFVTARRLAAYGASVTHLVDAQYFMAGLPLSVILWLTAVVVALARRHNPKPDEGKLQRRVGWAAIVLFLIWAAAELVDFILEKSSNRHILGQTWFDLYLMTGVRLAFGLTVLWYLIVHRQTGFFARMRKSLSDHGMDAGAASELQIFGLYVVVFVIITSSVRAMRVYDALPQAYGGGRPTRVQLYVEREKTPKELLVDSAEDDQRAMTYTVPLDLLFRTSDTFIVDAVGDEAGCVWTLDAGTVHAVLFGSDKRASP